jgi:hypothetical protein
VLGVVSVLRPREFWGVDVGQIQGWKADARARLIRRRQQLGTAGFFAAGAAFACLGIYLLIS